MENEFYFFVEGPTDSIFVEHVFRPLVLKKGYEDCIIYEYSTKKPRQVNALLSNLMQHNVQFIFIGDIDDKPCITKAKEALLATYRNLQNAKIVVVKMEIESLYIAGVAEPARKVMNYREALPNTEHFTKEDFRLIQYVAKNGDNPTMALILESYDAPMASQSNATYKYLSDSVSALPIFARET